MCRAGTGHTLNVRAELWIGGIQEAWLLFSPGSFHPEQAAPGVRGCAFGSSVAFARRLSCAGMFAASLFWMLD